METVAINYEVFSFSYSKFCPSPSFLVHPSCPIRLLHHHLLEPFARLIHVLFGRKCTQPQKSFPSRPKPSTRSCDNLRLLQNLTEDIPAALSTQVHVDVGAVVPAVRLRMGSRMRGKGGMKQTGHELTMPKISIRQIKMLVGAPISSSPSLSLSLIFFPFPRCTTSSHAPCNPSPLLSPEASPHLPGNS